MSACITLYTDAGFCPTHSVGSWAAWAKFTPDQPTMRRSGVFSSDKVANFCSSTCEAKAIVNGLSCALGMFRPAAGTLVVIVSDSLVAAQALMGKPFRKLKMRQRFEKIRAAWNALIGSWGIKTEIRHVRGHKGVVTARNAVNTWCDRECSRLLTAARQAAIAVATLSEGASA